MAKREKKLSFEESLFELEALVNQLETGRLPLDESFGTYERGIALLKQLDAQLKQHEEKVALLTADGEQPLDIEEGD